MKFDNMMDYLRNRKTRRPWGYYKELYEGDGFKVKELVINPYSSLSMQRHKHRSETWNLVSGECSIRIIDEEKKMMYSKRLISTFEIPLFTWHQGTNRSDKPAHIVEIWRGESKQLSESDIERIDIDSIQRILGYGLLPE